MTSDDRLGSVGDHDSSSGTLGTPRQDSFWDGGEVLLGKHPNALERPATARLQSAFVGQAIVGTVPRKCLGDCVGKSPMADSLIDRLVFNPGRSFAAMSCASGKSRLAKRAKSGLVENHQVAQNTCQYHQEHVRGQPLGRLLFGLFPTCNCSGFDLRLGGGSGSTQFGG